MRLLAGRNWQRCLWSHNVWVPIAALALFLGSAGASDDDARTASLVMPGLGPPQLPPMEFSKAEPPATRPVAPNQATTQAVESKRPYPDDYQVLIRRSIFARGGTPAMAKGAANPQPGGPEGNLGLMGIFSGDGEFTAFIEDLAAKHTLKLRIGDAVGVGHVTAISLASIEYEAGGKSKKIMVGQNLLGAALPPPAPPATQPAQAPPGGPPAGPGQPAPGGMPPGMNPQQMEQMMRARMISR